MDQQVGVGDEVETPAGRGIVVALDGRWATVAVDRCGFVTEAVVKVTAVTGPASA